MFGGCASSTDHVVNYGINFGYDNELKKQSRPKYGRTLDVTCYQLNVSAFTGDAVGLCNATWDCNWKTCLKQWGLSLLRNVQHT